MATWVHVSNGLVDNRAVFPDSGLPADWPDASNWHEDENAQIGWSFDGTSFTAPPAPPTPAPSTNPADYVLTKRQISAALIVSGTTTDPNTYVATVLGKVSDPTQRALALNDWNNPPAGGWSFSDPLISTIATDAGLSSQQIAQFWLLGAQQTQ